MDNFHPRFGFWLDVEVKAIVSFENLQEMLQPLSPVPTRNPGPVPANSTQCMVRQVNRERYVITTPYLPPTAESSDYIAALCSMLPGRTSSGERLSWINASCSLRVHFDVSMLAPIELVEIMGSFYRLEKAIFKIQPPSRHNLFEESSLRNNLRSKIGKLSSLNPYENSPVSLRDLLSNGSLSVHYGAGTTNGRKISTWYALLDSIINRTLVFGGPDRDLNSISEVADWLEWSRNPDTQTGSLRAFFQEREESFITRRRERLRERYGDETIPSEIPEQVEARAEGLLELFTAERQAEDVPGPQTEDSDEVSEDSDEVSEVSEDSDGEDGVE